MFGDDPYIGMTRPLTMPNETKQRPFFVKAKLPTIANKKSRYLLCNIEGFKNTYCEVDEEWVQMEFREGASVLQASELFHDVTSFGESFGHSLSSSYDGDLLEHIYQRL